MEKLELTFENGNGKVSRILENYVSNHSTRVVTDGKQVDGDQTFYLFPEILFTNDIPSDKGILIRVFSVLLAHPDEEGVRKTCLSKLVEYCESIDFSPMGPHRKLLDHLRPNNGKQGTQANFYDREGYFCLYGDDQLLTESDSFAGKAVFYK